MGTRLWLVMVMALGTVTPAVADWIVYLGGGVQETKGAWEVRGRQVLFHAPSGTLLSARSEDVDVAASAFLSWQVAERRKAPTVAPAAPSQVTAGKGQPQASAEPCKTARVVQVLAAETLEITAEGRSETVHLAGLDAPETRHKFPQLAWFGRESAGVVERLTAKSPSVCVSEESPPQRDRQKHRVVFVRLQDGRDLGAELIARGLALARAGVSTRGPAYRQLEVQAQLAEDGHWGPTGVDASIAIVSHAMAFSAAPPPRASGGG